MQSQHVSLEVRCNFSGLGSVRYSFFGLGLVRKVGRVGWENTDHSFHLLPRVKGIGSVRVIYFI